MMKKEIANGFVSHVMLYAKGHYKNSPLCKYDSNNSNNTDHINNLKTLLGKWSNIEVEYILDEDVWKFVISALMYCLPHDLEEGILEMLGERWVSTPFMSRKPIQVALGKISTIHKDKFVLLPLITP